MIIFFIIFNFNQKTGLSNPDNYLHLNKVRHPF
jgi:hypothetical protein